MKIDRSKASYLLFELFALAILMLLIPLFMFLDITVLKNGMSELSITEFMQEFYIFVTALIFFSASAKHPESKGLFILIAGLFGAMFIREGDYYLDYIVHGFWQYPVMILFAFTGYSAYKHRKNIRLTIERYIDTKEFTFIIIGFLITIAFSRVFGTGKIWRPIMGDGYLHLYKTAIQEGLELLGYTLIFYGSILFTLGKKELQ